MTDKAFTGHARRRKTSRAVKAAEVISRTAITIGGLGTVLVVGTICIFLVAVVVPLFRSPSVDGPRGSAGLSGAAVSVAIGLDEQQLLGWELLADGTAISFRGDDGSEITRQSLFVAGRPVALDVDRLTGGLVAGFADGSVRFGRVTVKADYFLDEQLPADEQAALAGLGEGAVAVWRQGVVRRTPEGQLRLHTLAVELEESLAVGSESAIVALDHALGGETGGRTTRVLGVLQEDGSLTVSRVTSRPNLLTGKPSTTLRKTVLPFEARPDAGPPHKLLVSERGDMLYVAWKDGLLLRFEVTPQGEAELAEMVNVAPGAGVSLADVEFMSGRTTLIVGDSAGTLRGWFLAREHDAGPRALVVGHSFPATGEPVTALVASTRSRLFGAGFADGSVRLYHMTTDQQLVESVLEGGQPVQSLALAPRDDGFAARAGTGRQLWDLQADHSETTWAALIAPVWYEGDASPRHTWQSSSGTDDFEPKLGLLPLVFGTLKATSYSMLFSVPIALLAALYTSEFLSRRLRGRVKEVIEMMASLPSVVLGFLAALWLAPIIERVVPGTLAAAVCVPLALLLGAHLWQLLPQHLALQWAGKPRLLLMGVAVLLGILVGGSLGAPLERLLFAGDVRAWLDGQAGGALGGWLLLLLPVSALLVGWAAVRWVKPAMSRTAPRWGRATFARIDLARYVSLLGATVGLALLGASLLDVLGHDLRDGLMLGQADVSPIGTYVQRNALIVGFVLGFAVIPIIYTLADDALAAVPDHLRAASLATGATPWQTAVRVVVPTAMSGLFSAVMIGLGRAVGETMIVLMAAGNTPVLEANLFNGFRTLSATIAVELPEAVQGGSLYRVLFLSALTLFAITFVINTLAELVRQRFRRRAYQL